MPLSIWIGLLLCNIAWSINPSVAKILIEEVGPQHTAWIKYTAAFLAYLIGMMVLRPRGNAEPFVGRVLMKPKERRDLFAVIAIGAATCFLSPMTQMLGLEASTAVNNSILVTFEPIFTVIFGWIILGERLRRLHYATFALAIFGFLLLSRMVLLFLSGASIPVSASIGDLVILIAIAGESIYSVLARRLTKLYPGTVIFGSAMLVGVILLSVVVIPWKGLPNFGSLSSRGWAAILWIGILGTTAPYLYWLHALNRSLSLGSVVLSLFLQPIIGTAAGFLFLGETLGTAQVAGAGLIIAAVIVQVICEQRAVQLTPGEAKQEGVAV